MKHRKLIAGLLMAGLLGSGPGLALADGYGRNQAKNDHRWEHRDDRGRHDHDRGWRDNDRKRHDKWNHDYRKDRIYRPVRHEVRPSIGAVVAALPFGFSVSVVNGNTYFRAGELHYRRVPTGYMVCEKPLVVTAPRYFSNALIVQTTLLNIRSGPGMGFAITGQAIRGERLYMRGNADGWYYVETSAGMGGWVMAQFTSPYAAG